jgi:hypothetical protein
VKAEFENLPVTSEIYDSNNNIKASAILKYVFTKRGPLASTSCDHGALVSTTGRMWIWWSRGLSRNRALCENISMGVELHRPVVIGGGWWDEWGSLPP